MPSETIRNHQKYLGLTKQMLADTKTGLVLTDPFIVIGEINLFSWSIHWTYDVFASIPHFDAGGNSIADFRRPFRLDAEFAAFKQSNAALFAAFDARFRALVQPSPSVSAEIETAQFRILDYQLNISFEDGDNFPVRRLRNDAYHQTITDNTDIIGFNRQTGAPGLIPILHAAAGLADAEFFAGTSLVLE